MQIFVSGTWKSEKAEPYASQAMELGIGLANAGVDLACGPGTGIARFVIDGYLSATARGQVTYYLPRDEDMLAAGEEVRPGADRTVRTGFDYPMRNVFQVGQCQGLFVLTGGDGALEEILPALIDYRIPVGIVEGAGTAAAAVAVLADIYPEWHEWLLFGPDVPSMIDEFLSRVMATQLAPES